MMYYFYILRQTTAQNTSASLAEWSTPVSNKTADLSVLCCRLQSVCKTECIDQPLSEAYETTRRKCTRPY